jgi:hypothetical protein
MVKELFTATFVVSLGDRKFLYARNAHVQGKKHINHTEQDFSEFTKPL